MEQSVRVGLSSGMVATRRAIGLVPSRQPLRHQLFDRLIEYWPLCEVGSASSIRTGLILGKKLGQFGTVASGAGIGSIAASFSGNGSAYLTIASDSDLRIGNVAHTVAAWFNSNLALTTQIICSKDDVTGSNREHSILRTNGSNQGFGQLFDGVNTSVASGGATPPGFSINTWNLMATTFNPTGPVQNNFINSTKVAGVVTGTPGTNATAMVVGGDLRASNTVGFSGLIMRLAIWKRVLGDDELNYLYNAGLGRDFPWL